MMHSENESLKESIKVRKLIEEREKVQATISHVVLKGGKFVGYIGGKEVTTQGSHEKALVKMAKYCKSQGQ